MKQRINTAFTHLVKHNRFQLAGDIQESIFGSDMPSDVEMLEGDQIVRQARRMTLNAR